MHAVLLRFGIAIVVALLVPTTGLGSEAASDKRLAEKLIAGSGDVPRSWIGVDSPAHPLVSCIENGVIRTGTRARSAFGSPNSGVWSFAAVYAQESRTTRFYRAALDLVPTCVRQMLRSGFMPQHIAPAQRRDIGRYGDRSQAWRMHFLQFEGSRRAYDWVVVRTGRGVLVNVFLVAYLDARGRDRTRDASGGMWGIELERTVLRNALARAARN